jgi:solute carrier family 25 2-oxodicarboxylate transporter 21
VNSQLQSGTATGAEAYTGMVDCFQKIVRTEGHVNPSLQAISV